MTLSIFVLSLLTAQAVFIQAAEPLQQIALDRKQVVYRALIQNPELRVVRLAITEAEKRAINAGALKNPEIAISGSTDAPFNDEGEQVWSVALQQSFPITGRLRTLLRIAELEIELARAEARAAENQLAYKVELLADRITSLDWQISLLKDQEELNQRFATFLRSKVNRGEASSLDVRRVQVEAAALRQQAARLRRQRLDSSAKLGLALGLKPEAARGLIIKSSGAFLPAQLPSYAEKQLAGHPTYALKQRLVEIASQRTSLAVAERWADITIEVMFEEERTVDAPEELETERFIGFGVSIPLPIYDRGEGQIEGSRVRKERQRLELEAAGLRLLAEAESIRFRYEDLQKQIDQYQRQIIEAEADTLQEMESAYNNGQIGLNDVFRVREKLLEHRKELLDMKLERLNLLTEWRFATGQTPQMESK